MCIRGRTSRFAIGDVVLEMTQIGKECHNDCVIKQKTAYEIVSRDWSSDVCSSDLKR